MPPGFRKFNEVILLPKNMQTDMSYIDPLKPLPKQWLEIVRLIDEEKRTSSQQPNIKEHAATLLDDKESVIKSGQGQKPPLPRMRSASGLRKAGPDSQASADPKSQNQLNIVANLSQSVQAQILKCNSVIFGPQVQLQQEDEILRELKRLQMVRRHDFIKATDA